MKKVILLMTLSAAVLSGCGPKQTEGKKEAPAYAAMVADTTTAYISTDFAAELQSEQVVDIRPRVSGYIDQIMVAEGAKVRKGEVIFKINKDDLMASYQEAVASAEAAQAALANARLEVQKVEPLVEKQILSAFELKTAKSNLSAAKAQVAAAKSRVRNAKVSLGYATITSPVNGVVGRIVARPGTLVSSSANEPLTTVSSSGPVSAYFSINENLMLDLFEKSASSGIELSQLKKYIPAASLVLSNGNVYPESGEVELASGIVDITTGSAQLKATFPNEGGLLRTGASAKVRISTPHNGVVVIPQSATYELQDKIMVYKIDETGKVSSQNVDVYGRVGTDYVLKSGLEKGDKIALEGLDYIKEGDVIKIK